MVAGTEPEITKLKYIDSTPVGTTLVISQIYAMVCLEVYTYIYKH